MENQEYYHLFPYYFMKIKSHDLHLLLSEGTAPFWTSFQSNTFREHSMDTVFESVFFQHKKNKTSSEGGNLIPNTCSFEIFRHY